MTDKNNTPALAFAKVGNFGVELAKADGYVLLKIPTDRAGSQPSQSGKMDLVASTGGWIKDGDFRLNVMAGYGRVVG